MSIKVPSRIANKKCDRCTEDVFDHPEDAQEFWDNYLEHNDYDGNLEEAEDAAFSDAPSLCGYCDHMMNKDD